MSQISKVAKNICPACGGQCVRGGVYNNEPDSSLPIRFYPSDVKYFLFPSTVKLLKGQCFEACINCGLVWSQLNSDTLRDVLSKNGIPDGKVPKRKSYIIHLAKWVLFILMSGVAALWLSSIW